MFRKSMLILALLASGAAHGQIVRVDGSAVSQPGEVHLKWSPLEWDPSVTGMEVRRRTGDGAWDTLGRTTVPGSYRARWLQSDIDNLGVNTSLMNFTAATQAGFGFIDKAPPTEPVMGKVTYALHAVANGAVNEDAARYIEWSIGQHVSIAQPIEYLGSLWSDAEATVIFKTNPFQLAVDSAGYRIFEERDGQRRDIGGGLNEPLRRNGNPPYLCVRLKKPYADAIVVQVENSFGFKSEVSAPVDAKAPKKTARDFGNPDCNPPPVIADFADGPRPPPPPSPPAVPKPATPESQLFQGAVLHLDVNKALRVVNGQAIQWPDNTANHNDAAMSDVNRQPTYYGGSRGRRLSLAGGKWLQFTRPLASPTFTIVLVLADERKGSDGLRPILAGSPGHETPFIAFAERATLVVAGNDGKEISSAKLVDKREMVLALRFDGKSLAVWQDDKPATTLKLPRKTRFSFDALGNHGGGGYLGGELRAAVAFDQPLDASRIAQIVQLLRHDFRVPNY